MSVDLTHSSHDVLDSRDIIERLNELQDELDDLEFFVAEADDEIDNWVEPDEPDEATDAELEKLKQNKLDAQSRLDDWLKENEEEYNALKALDDDASDYCDWVHGETLIHEDYFTKYAEELASDIGAVDRNASWPLNHIDWDAAAEQLKDDYTPVDFYSSTFYVRTS
jgi:hypothetical protein